MLLQSAVLVGLYLLTVLVVSASVQVLLKDGQQRLTPLGYIGIQVMTLIAFLLVVIPK